MRDDQQLLERYVRDHAEDAFTELVDRHIGLVYSAALRQVNGNIALAQDVTQGVFVELARQAGKLRRHPALSGWLYITTRRLALFTMRGEARRSRREQMAHVMDELSRETEACPDWETLAPVLDEAMHELGEKDRQAVLLRYFERHEFRVVGTALGLSDGAARMRVERALDKLRECLARRGITSSASSISAALASHAVTHVPGALVPGVITGALATPLAATPLIWMLPPGTAAGKVAGAVILAVLLIGWWQQHEINGLRAEKRRLEAGRRTLAQPARAGLPTQEVTPLAPPDSTVERRELLRLRGEVALLRRDTGVAASPPGGSGLLNSDLTPETRAFVEFALKRRAAAVDWLTILTFHETRHDGQTTGSLEAAWATWFSSARPDPNSDNFAVRQAALDGSWRPRHPEAGQGLAAGFFELVYREPLRSVTDPARTIVLRERAPRWDGDAWTRTYCFADRHCVDQREATGDFSAWEREQRSAPEP